MSNYGFDWDSIDKEWEENYKPEGDRHKVFVYGTLRKGHGNNGYFKNDTSVFLESRHVAGYELYSTKYGGVPMVLEVESEESSAFGEVYEVNTETLKDLDFLEGHPTGWKRRKLKEDESIWIYTAPSAGSIQGMHLVEDGDWAKHKAESPSYVPVYREVTLD